MVGRTGFIGMTGYDFSNRYSLFGHSGYFQDGRGKETDDYMREHWLPLIAEENAPVAQFDERSTLNAWRGFTIWLSNNFQFIKLGYIFAPFILAFIWIGSLYIEANAAKERMLAVVDLEQAMKREGRLPPEVQPYIDAVQNALRLPLEQTAVLWVDDNPSNNLQEKRALRRFGLCFTEVTTTRDAISELERHPYWYSVVISVMKRQNNPLEGLVLLEEMKQRPVTVPLIFYSSNFTSKEARQAQESGAQNEVRDAMELWSEVLRAINPSRLPIGKTRLVFQALVGCPDQ